MTKFEEWADDCDETDEKYYAIPVGSVARGVARDAWNSALDEAAKVCESKRLAWVEKFGGNTPFDAGRLSALGEAEEAILAFKEKE